VGDSFCYSQADRDAQDTDPATATSFIAKATFNEQGSAAGASGGNARAASLTPKQRTTIASNAAKARWSKKSV